MKQPRTPCPSNATVDKTKHLQAPLLGPRMVTAGHSVTQGGKELSPLLQDLFVLEMANNPWGRIERAKSIVGAFAKVVSDNGVKAAIKFQLRNVDTFIHPDFVHIGQDDPVTKLSGVPRYVQKTRRTQLTRNEVHELVHFIRDNGCIPMATAFDETSIDLVEELGMQAIKIASSDLTDWGLLERCAATGLPVILSTGGHEIGDVIKVVEFFSSLGIEVAINSCVSLYPTEDQDLNLDHIDVLKATFPESVIGLSTHEYTDWQSSMLISYAKGARTWERHIDLPYPTGHEQSEVSPYCSLPSQIDTWFKAYRKAQEMCGTVSEDGREIGQQETDYLNALKRGAYLARDVREGEVLSREDFFFAIPLQHQIGQLPSGDAVKSVWYAKKSMAVECH